MYTAREMFEVKPIGADLVKRTQLIVFEPQYSGDEVYDNIDCILTEARNMRGVPDFSSVVTVHRLYNNTVDHVKVTLKLRASDTVADNNLRKSFILPYVSGFKMLLLNFIAAWVEEYKIAKRVQVNIDAINGVLKPLCGIIKLSFVYSDIPVISVTANSIVLGVTAENAAGICTQQVFHPNEGIRDIALKALESEVQSFTSPFDVLKSKKNFFISLGVYTRSGIPTVMRRTYRKDVARAVKDREVCRFEYRDAVGKYFGLIEKVKKSNLTAEDKPIFEKGDYAYIIVVRPFGKTGKEEAVLTDEDTALMLDTMVA